MMKKIFVLLPALFLTFTITAQSTFPEWVQEQDSLPEIINKVSPQQDSRLTRMVQWQVENNQKKNGVDGWSVNIFSSSGNNAMEQAMRVKQEFLTLYPDVPVYVQFIAPDFKVRAGNFRTRNEALKLRKQIIGKYPKSYEVWGKIKFPGLTQESKETGLNE